MDNKQTSEEDLQKQFQTHLQSAKKFMDPIHQRMDRDYEVYRNFRQTDDTRFKVSDLFSYVETVVPIVTNNRIRANVRSDYPDYVTHAKGVNDILDNTYDINNWDYESQVIMRMALIYRSSIAYTGYDGEYKNGTGRLCIKKVNPRWCYLDPAAVESDDAQFFFYVEPKRKTEVIKMHPDKKLEIQDAVGKSRATQSSGSSNTWFKSWVNAVKNFVTFSGNNQMRIADQQIIPELSEEEKHKNSVAYIHYWYRDDKDKWRVSYWADDVFLQDLENPFWHECLPYDVYSPVKDPLSVLGIPISEQIETLNFERNCAMRYIIDNAKLHGNPPLIYNTSMGNVKDPQALREQARGDGVVSVNNPDMVPLSALADYMSVPTMPAYAIELPDMIAAIEDKQTGVNDSFRGMSDATSGKEVQLKQEAAYTRIKTMIDQFELFNKRIAEKTIVNAMQFYKQDRAFRIKGDYTKYQDIVNQQNQQPAEPHPGQPMQPAQQQQPAPFMVEPIQKGTNPDTQDPVYDRSEFYLYANPNEWTQINPGMAEPDDGEQEDPEQQQVEQAYKILQFTVEIEAGSSLPTSRLGRREEALELAKMQLIDQESVLDIFDWPDREEVIKRMQDAAKAQQQAQAQQQQAQAQAQAQQQQDQAQMQAQQQAHSDQAKMQAQMQMKQMDIQAGLQKQAMGDHAKVQQSQAKQGQSNPQPPNLAALLDNIRRQVPEAADMTDQQLLQAIGH